MELLDQVFRPLLVTSVYFNKLLIKKRKISPVQEIINKKTYSYGLWPKLSILHAPKKHLASLVNANICKYHIIHSPQGFSGTIYNTNNNNNNDNNNNNNANK